jgi:hypothetical protein
MIPTNAITPTYSPITEETAIVMSVAYQIGYSRLTTRRTN